MHFSRLQRILVLSSLALTLLAPSVVLARTLDDHRISLSFYAMANYIVDMKGMSWLRKPKVGDPNPGADIDDENDRRFEVGLAGRTIPGIDGPILTQMTIGLPFQQEDMTENRGERVRPFLTLYLGKEAFADFQSAFPLHKTNYGQLQGKGKMYVWWVDPGLITVNLYDERNPGAFRALLARRAQPSITRLAADPGAFVFSHVTLTGLVDIPIPGSTTFTMIVPDHTNSSRCHRVLVTGSPRAYDSRDDLTVSGIVDDPIWGNSILGTFARLPVLRKPTIHRFYGTVTHFCDFNFQTN